ncbi:CBF/NF-Y family transcription factor [Aspergillus flavus]|nr:CBF/NF-Y family transcription factor [Aspergillus flavus]
MPPRKSTSETVEDPASPSQAQTQSPPTQSQPIQATEQQLKARAEGGVSIEDYLLPRSLTLRLAKSVLPPNTSIQKDAVLAIQKAATVANEATLKRTVAPSDVFSAISELEFDGFRSRLEKELDAFTELKAGKRKAKKGGTEVTAAEGVKGSAASEGGGGASRGAKRVKRVEGEEAASSRPEEGDDGDETQDEAEQVDEQEHESEAEEDDEGEEEEEEEEEEPGEEEDIDRVEDLDRDSRARRLMDPDAAGDESDSDDDAGPSSQLRGDLGLG